MADPRVIVYTALMGAYDQVVGPPARADPTVRYLCLTDRPELIPRGWAAVGTPTISDIDSRIRQARFFKTHPHTVLGPHEVSIWIDANLALVKEPLDLVATLGACEVATFAYPSTYGPRDCIYQEGAACIARGKDDRAVIEAHLQRYLREGYPANNGLVETSVVVRRNTPTVAKFNEHWWSEIRRGSRRDQLSFNYSAWRMNLAYAVIPGSRRCNGFTDFRPHMEQIYAG